MSRRSRASRSSWARVAQRATRPSPRFRWRTSSARSSGASGPNTGPAGGPRMLSEDDLAWPAGAVTPFPSQTPSARGRPPNEGAGGEGSPSAGERPVDEPGGAEGGGPEVSLAPDPLAEAAALPGAVAAHTELPVIGVPLSGRLSAAGGLDAILSIVQMPPGVPVACVGLDNPRNAAILAAQILGA